MVATMVRLTDLNDLDQAAERLRTLTQPHRLRMGQMVLRRCCSVGELAEACASPGPMSSKRLRLMHHGGRLVSERAGRRSCFRVADAHLPSACAASRLGAASGVQLAAATARGEPIDPLLASCNHLGEVVEEINHSIAGRIDDFHRRSGDRERAAFVDQVARRNVQRTVAEIYARSRTLRGLVDADRIAIVGAMYDVTTGHIEFLLPDSYGSNLLEDLADVVAKSPVVGGP